MNKEELLEAIVKLLHEDSYSLSRDMYKELLNEVIDSCKDSLNAMEEEDQ